MSKIYAVDLDHTLCIPNESGKDSFEKYGLATPIQSIIDKVNQLHEAGNKIVLYTARRMVTHSGDVQKVINDVGSITEKWLSEHGVQYDQLVFGKIYADVYLDDKALRPEEL